VIPFEPRPAIFVRVRFDPPLQIESQIMPLKLNCGLSQKVGDANFGSHGASVNVEVELDSGLIAEPTGLQERIRSLFGQLRISLTEELNRTDADNRADEKKPSGSPAHAVPTGGQSTQNPGPSKSTPRATQSQLKAIIGIAKKQQIDLAAYLQANYRVNRPEDLDIKAASRVIDALKSGGAERRAA